MRDRTSQSVCPASGLGRPIPGWVRAPFLFFAIVISLLWRNALFSPPPKGRLPVAGAVHTDPVFGTPTRDGLRCSLEGLLHKRPLVAVILPVPAQCAIWNKEGADVPSAYSGLHTVWDCSPLAYMRYLSPPTLTGGFRGATPTSGALDQTGCDRCLSSRFVGTFHYVGKA